MMALKRSGMASPSHFGQGEITTKVSGECDSAFSSRLKGRLAMETNVLDALGKLWQHGHGMFGWCSDCGSPSRYWNDVKARRTAQAAAGRRVRYRSYCASVASAVASIAPEPFDPIFC